MTSIGGAGGPGGIGGGKPPGGVDEVRDVGEVGDIGDVADVRDVAAPATAAAPRLDVAELDAMAGDLAAGRLTAHEAVERLVAKAGVGLPHAEQVELRELFTDLVANDPYLGSLVGRL